MSVTESLFCESCHSQLSLSCQIWRRTEFLPDIIKVGHWLLMMSSWLIWQCPNVRGKGEVMKWWSHIWLELCGRTLCDLYPWEMSLCIHEKRPVHFSLSCSSLSPKTVSFVKTGLCLDGTSAGFRTHSHCWGLRDRAGHSMPIMG